jgi:hypothetical protein
METKPWETDIKDWTKISEKTATLILNQGEAVLKETIETAKTISARAERMIAILIPICSILVIYFISNIKDFGSFLHLTSFLCLLVVATSLFFCVRNMFKYTIAITGEFPKNLATSELIDGDFKDSEQYINMLLYIYENIQKRIEINEFQNTIRMADNERTLRVLLLLPICPLFSALIFFLSVNGCAPA